MRPFSEEMWKTNWKEQYKANCAFPLHQHDFELNFKFLLHVGALADYLTWDFRGNATFQVVFFCHTDSRVINPRQ